MTGKSISYVIYASIHRTGILTAHFYSTRLSYKVRPVISPSSYPTYFPLNWQRTATNPDTLREIAFSRAKPRAMILIERLTDFSLTDPRRYSIKSLYGERTSQRDRLRNFVCFPWEVSSSSRRITTTLWQAKAKSRFSLVKRNCVVVEVYFVWIEKSFSREEATKPV